jgi:hypothetical protein
MCAAKSVGRCDPRFHRERARPRSAPLSPVHAFVRCRHECTVGRSTLLCRFLGIERRRLEVDRAMLKEGARRIVRFGSCVNQPSRSMTTERQGEQAIDRGAGSASGCGAIRLLDNATLCSGWPPSRDRSPRAASMAGVLEACARLGRISRELRSVAHSSQPSRRRTPAINMAHRQRDSSRIACGGLRHSGSLPLTAQCPEEDRSVSARPSSTPADRALCRLNRSHGLRASG